MLKNKKIREIILLNLATICYAIGINLFFQPHQIVPGALSGLGIIVQHYVGLNIALFTMYINIILLVMAFIFIGRSFAIKSLLGGVIFLPCYLYIIPNVMLVDSILLSTILGGIINGVGVTLLYYSHGSAGGTSLIGKIISKCTSLKYAISVSIVDAIIVFMGLLVFGVIKSVYAVIAITLTIRISKRIENKKLSKR